MPLLASVDRSMVSLVVVVEVVVEEEDEEEERRCAPDVFR